MKKIPALARRRYTPMSQNPTTYDRSPDARTLRRLAIVVREILKSNPDVTSGELAHLVKDRLATLRLPWQPWQLHHVLERIDQRGYVPSTPTTPPARPPPQADPPWGPYDREPAQWTSVPDLIAQWTDARPPTTRD